jgi:hypothetical protein
VYDAGAFGASGSKFILLSIGLEIVTRSSVAVTPKFTVNDWGVVS